jgi:hypothetical protein
MRAILLFTVVLLLNVGCRQTQQARPQETARQSAEPTEGRFVGREEPGFLRDESDYYVADPVAGHLHKPRAERRFPWDEHETGEIVMRTNNLGFRNDEDVTIEKPAGTCRILITGDSHIDGVVYNRENVAYRLGELLRSGASGRRYEVWNGGAGYYGFHNYHGFLEKSAYLAPDVFIVIAYMGNDFLGALEVEADAGRLTVPERSARYWNALRQAASDPQVRHLVAQEFNQIYFFKHFPEMKRVSLRIVQQELGKMHRRCVSQDIECIVLLLPTHLEIRGVSQSEAQQALSRLGLSTADREVTRELSVALAEWLRSNGMPYLNLREPMMRGAEDYFWKKDHHLNGKGHELIAEVLYAEYAYLFEAPH